MSRPFSAANGYPVAGLIATLGSWVVSGIQVDSSALALVGGSAAFALLGLIVVRLHRRLARPPSPRAWIVLSFMAVAAASLSFSLRRQEVVLLAYSSLFTLCGARFGSDARTEPK